MKRDFTRYIITLIIAFFVVVTPLLTEASRPILIEGAMECETDVLIEKLQNPQEQRIGGWRFISGDYEGIPLVVSVTSVGMTNAAAATVLGIETYHPFAVPGEPLCLSSQYRIRYCYRICDRKDRAAFVS